jgi:hypothetical protein
MTMSDELKLRDEWTTEARAMTLEKLPAFIEKLTTHKHDYGTICRAIAAAGVAAAYAVERSPSGGITGFQAGCVLWDLILGWDSSYEGKPIRLVNYEDMLYPQYADKFRSISGETWAHLQKRATELLAKNKDGIVAERVKAHWESVVAGEVPFGYRVESA